MRLLFGLFIFSFFSTAQAKINFTAKQTCSVQKFVSAPYFENDKPQIGAIAHLQTESSYELITLNSLISDKFIYFENPDGLFTTEYLWLYSRPTEIKNLNISPKKKYYSASVVGDVIITIEEHPLLQGGFTEVSYSSIDHGFLFSLKCKIK